MRNHRLRHINPHRHGQRGNPLAFGPRDVGAKPLRGCKAPGGCDPVRLRHMPASVSLALIAGTGSMVARVGGPEVG
jgi:hypothetical protein